MNIGANLTKIIAKKKKRRGRGGGSGRGFHTTGTGTKGQGSRAGYNKRWWFEGGQNPLVRALPHKRGFKRAFAKKVIGINLYQLQKVGQSPVTEEAIRKTFGIPAEVSIKILGKGNVKGKIELKGVAISAQAARKLERAAKGAAAKKSAKGKGTVKKVAEKKTLKGSIKKPIKRKALVPTKSGKAQKNGKAA
jgi:large subunit ribosomal protein L15